MDHSGTPCGVRGEGALTFIQSERNDTTHSVESKPGWKCRQYRNSDVGVCAWVCVLSRLPGLLSRCHGHRFQIPIAHQVSVACHVARLRRFPPFPDLIGSLQGRGGFAEKSIAHWRLVAAPPPRDMQGPDGSQRAFIESLPQSEHCHNCFTQTNQYWMKWVLLLCPLYRQGDWGTDRVSNMHKVTRFASGGARMWIQAAHISRPQSSNPWFVLSSGGFCLDRICRCHHPLHFVT